MNNQKDVVIHKNILATKPSKKDNYIKKIKIKKVNPLTGNVYEVTIKAS